MENAILIVVLAAILGGAIAYIVKAKRSGVKCIGCSAGGQCAQKKGGACGECYGAEDCGNECVRNCGCHKGEETNLIANERR